jgi:MFS transporter, FHS family, glucose/mannose:H+ symporter
MTAYPRSFWAACLSMLVFGIVMISLGSINMLLSAKLSLDNLAVGALAALLPLGILLGSVVFGPIVDRYGYRLFLTLSLVLVALALELIAFSESENLVRIAFLLIGFGGGMMNGGANALVSDISEVQKGANLNLLGVFYGLGALGFPVVTGALSGFISYNAILHGIVVLVVIIALFIFSSSLPKAKHAQGLPIKEALSLLKSPLIWLFGLILFFESGMEGMANNWSARYFNEINGLAQQDALFTLSVLIVGLTVTRFLMGTILKNLSLAMTLTGALAFILSGSVLLLLGRHISLSIMAMALLGIGFAPVFPMILGLTGEKFAKFSGTAFSIVLVIALMGNTILNYLVGLLSIPFTIAAYPVILIISVGMMALLISISLNKTK